MPGSLATATSPGRLLFIDNLRWSAILMVVVMHAAVTYSPFGRWYYRDPGQTGFAGALLFGSYQSFQHAVSMGLLFGIAGYFASGAIERRGAVGFLRERGFRLGLPLLLYMSLIGPVTEWYVAGSWHATPPQSFPAAWAAHVANGSLLSGSGPLWFCLVLLAFSAVFAAVWTVSSGTRREGAPPGPLLVLCFVAAMAAITFAVGVLAPHAGVVLNIDVHDLPQYPFMFAAGVLAHRQGWLMRLPSATGRAWGLAGLAISAVSWVLIISLGGALQGRLAAYGGGWHWQAAAIDVWRSFTCVSLSLGVITLYRDHFNAQGSIARFLTRNAFGVYVFHAPILILATRVLHEWPADVAVRFVAASFAGIVLTFLFVGMVARRTPALRAIL